VVFDYILVSKYEDYLKLYVSAFVETKHTVSVIKEINQHDQYTSRQVVILIRDYVMPLFLHAVILFST